MDVKYFQEINSIYNSFIGNFKFMKNDLMNCQDLLYV